jgi:hypothetical protein
MNLTTEEKENQIILTFLGWKRCGCGNVDCLIMLSPRFTVIGRREKVISEPLDANLIRDAEQKLSHNQRADYTHKLYAEIQSYPIITGRLGIRWLLFDCPLSTRARILSEVVKEK